MNKSGEDYSEDSEIVSKFEKLDFYSLWRGREKVDMLEKSILSLLMGDIDGRRILDIGPGNGRLTGIVQKYSDEYVATDINMSFLKDVKEKYSKEKSLYVASNLYHLPFNDNSFSSIVMVRVFNFVSRPLKVLEEFSRIITPGGHLLISISPKPSLSTLIDDLKYRISYKGPKGQKKPSITFSNRDKSQVYPASYPTFAFKRSYISSLFSKAGFTEIAKISSGLEDYSILRLLPVRSLLRVGLIFRAVPIFPTTFFLVRKSGNVDISLLEFKEILRCPSCGGKLSTNADREEVFCGECQFVGSVKDGITDLTFVPRDAKVIEEGD